MRPKKPKTIPANSALWQGVIEAAVIISCCASTSCSKSTQYFIVSVILGTLLTYKVSVDKWGF
jgi:hypothetical protein